jgi:hypothetical protein
MLKVVPLVLASMFPVLGALVGPPEQGCRATLAEAAHVRGAATGTGSLCFDWDNTTRTVCDPGGSHYVCFFDSAGSTVTWNLTSGSGWALDYRSCPCTGLAYGVPGNIPCSGAGG